MNVETNRITVFEHTPLWVHKGKHRLTEAQLQALQTYFGDKGVPYYSLLHRGVKFKSYVGVIQIGDLMIEVLPKANKNDADADWRKALIGMLMAVSGFDIHTTSTSHLKVRPNSILEVYFELFMQEVERLLRQGLVKKYRKTESNRTSLKGAIQFPTHLRKNLVHQERFYVRHTTYDREHLLHSILFKTLGLISKLNSNPALVSRLGNLHLNFPEMPDVSVSDTLFHSITLNRKTESYKKAIEISRLILLNYHPDILRGNNNVLALMFDMNLLWERFVYASLVRHKQPGIIIRPQKSKLFWKADSGRISRMKPDIVLRSPTLNTNIVLDTKWKNLEGTTPSPEDLRQMYAYLKYHSAQKVALVFPGERSHFERGAYYKEGSDGLDDLVCGLASHKGEI